MSNEEPEIRHELPKVSKKKKLLYTASAFVIMFAICFLLLIVFWLVYPYKTAEIEVPIQVLNKNHEVAVGDNIILKVRATKYSNIAPTRSEFIICDDGSLTFLDPGETRTMPPGTFVVVKDDNVVPNKLAPGSVCRYRFRYGYKVNPIREIIKEWVSDNFLVIQGDDDAS